MKKTCFGCKALESNGHSYFCALQYQNETTYIPKHGTVKDIKPLEECPKPTSTKKLFEQLQINKK